MTNYMGSTAVILAAIAIGRLICCVWKTMWGCREAGDRSGGDSFATRSWSDLPPELAVEVLRRLPPRHLDRLHFGAVCRQWRAAARDNPALPPNFPWLALPDRSFYSLPGSSFGLLPVHLDGHRQLPHAQSSCGQWLVFERRDGALTLMSPFSAAAAIVLPGLHTLRHNDEPFKIAYDVQGPPIRKLVVCSENLVAAAVLDDEASPSTVRLALCRPGAASWSWAIVPGLNEVLKVRDIVLFQGKLYALSFRRSRLFSVSVEDVAGEPALSRVDHVIGALRTRSGRTARLPCYLLESGSKLLMIHAQSFWKPPEGQASAAIPTATTKFVVYVAMFEHWRWVVPTTEDILPYQAVPLLRQAVPDNTVLFLGPWCSRSVAIPEDLGLRSSIVFFSYNGRAAAADYHRKKVLFDCIAYDIKTGQSRSLLQKSVRLVKGFPATWLFPPIG